MDFRKRKEDAAGQVLGASAWDARLATLPTSYARLARAARSLDGIGVAAARPERWVPDHEPNAGREPHFFDAPDTSDIYLGVVA